MNDDELWARAALARMWDEAIREAAFVLERWSLELRGEEH